MTRRSLLCCLLLLSSTAFAADWPDVSAPPRDAGKGGGENDVAVIIGIEKYLVVAPVEGAADAAESWYSYLVRTRNTPAGRVHLIRNEEATAETLRDEADWAASVSNPKGTVWFIFVGHGAPAADGKDGVLVGADAQQTARNLYARSVPQAELLKRLSAGKQAQTVAVIDACFSGRTGTGEQLAPGLQPVIAVKVATPKKVLVLSAGKGNEFAGPLPGAHVPAFSYLALGALRGWADSNGDKNVTAEELTDYARGTLSALLRDRHQTPELFGPGDLVLARKTSEKGPDIADLVLSRPTAGGSVSVTTPTVQPSFAFTPAPAGIDESAIDPGANVCEDFYQYACGGWISKAVIPEDKVSWSRGFNAVQEANEFILRDILEEYARGEGTKTAYGAQLGDFWASCVDDAKLETTDGELKARLAALQPKDSKSLATIVGRLHAEGVPALFSFEPTTDLKDATLTIGEIDQGGFGMPDPAYYLSSDPRTTKIREEYEQHVARTFELLGQSKEAAASAAKNVLKLELTLAQAALDRASRRVPEKLYHRLNRDGLKREAPHFAWDAFFEALGAKSVQALNVTHVPYVQAVDGLAATFQPDALRDYLTFRYVDELTPALPRRFRAEQFAFKKLLTGQKQELERWRSCVRFADAMLGDALAAPFVERTFGADGKRKVTEMVRELKAAFASDVRSLRWMDEATRVRALAKLDKVGAHLVSPEKFKTYDGLKLTRTSFLQTVLAAQAFQRQRAIATIGKPADKDAWYMTAPTVNAYYDPSTNTLVFPAGILQPPFFSKDAADAVNFGGMGMMVAHELTHGFDADGRQFDESGNLRDWWTQSTADAFNTRASCVKEQYGTFDATDDLKVNGELTLGENVADVGGVKIAYRAFQRWQQTHPQSAVSHYTPDQAFFLGMAQSWCMKLTPEAARNRAKSDPHAPARWRVNGTFSNMSAFANAFGCRAGQKMVSRGACEVW